MSGLARDKVTKISFAIEVFGKERTMGDSLRFDVDAVELQKRGEPGNRERLDACTEPHHLLYYRL